jgi:hypothetical protein
MLEKALHNWTIDLECGVDIQKSFRLYNNLQDLICRVNLALKAAQFGKVIFFNSCRRVTVASRESVL